jgi:hypothetical protein
MRDIDLHINYILKKCYELFDKPFDIYGPKKYKKHYEIILM